MVLLYVKTKHFRRNMAYLTRTQAQQLLANPSVVERYMTVTKRRWAALKAFCASDVEWSRDFQDSGLGPSAWNEFIKRLQRSLEHLNRSGS